MCCRSILTILTDTDVAQICSSSLWGKLDRSKAAFWLTTMDIRVQGCFPVSSSFVYSSLVFFIFGLFLPQKNWSLSATLCWQSLTRVITVVSVISQSLVSITIYVWQQKLHNSTGWRWKVSSPSLLRGHKSDWSFHQYSKDNCDLHNFSSFSAWQNFSSCILSFFLPFFSLPLPTISFIISLVLFCSTTGKDHAIRLWLIGCVFFWKTHCCWQTII